MALIKCPECGNQISDKATSCPHCGYPIASTKDNEINNNIRSFTVAYRGGPGYRLPVNIIGFIAGIAALIGTIFMIIRGYFSYISFIIILLMITCVFLIVVGVVYFVFFYLNYKLGRKNCIEYNSEKDKLVLCTLFGEIIEIDAEDYINLRDNFFTDNMLLFTYRTKSGLSRKVKLGYCSNREEIRMNIGKVLNRTK